MIRLCNIFPTSREEGVCFNRGAFAHPHPCNLFVASWVHHTISGVFNNTRASLLLAATDSVVIVSKTTCIRARFPQIYIEQQHEGWHSLTRSCCTPRSSWASPIAAFLKCHHLSVFCLLNESVNWKVFYKCHLYYCVSKVWPCLNVWHYQLEIVRNFESQ